MGLSFDDRAKLARQSYAQAVEAARARPTPASWARLLRAARNRAAALRELHGFEAEPGARRRTARSSAGGAVRDAASSPAPAVRADARAARVGLARECERARALMAWSRALVEQSRALRDALATLAAEWSRPLPAPPGTVVP